MRDFVLTNSVVVSGLPPLSWCTDRQVAGLPAAAVSLVNYVIADV